MGTLLKPPWLNAKVDQGHRLGHRCIAAYPLNAGGGDNYHDASGNERHLTRSGNSITWESSIWGPAIKFGGSDDFLDMPFDPLAGNPHFTFLILYRQPVVSTQVLFGNRDSTLVSGIDVAENAGGVFVLRARGSLLNVQINLVGIGFDNLWHKLLATGTASGTTFAIDSRRAVSATVLGDLASGEFGRLGGETDGGQDFSGKIALALFWDRGMNANEINQVMSDPFALIDDSYE